MPFISDEEYEALQVAAKRNESGTSDEVFHAELEAAAPGDETRAVLAKHNRLEEFQEEDPSAIPTLNLSTEAQAEIDAAQGDDMVWMAKMWKHGRYTHMPQELASLGTQELEALMGAPTDRVEEEVS